MAEHGDVPRQRPGGGTTPGRGLLRTRSSRPDLRADPAAWGCCVPAAHVLGPRWRATRPHTTRLPRYVAAGPFFAMMEAVPGGGRLRRRLAGPARGNGGEHQACCSRIFHGEHPRDLGPMCKVKPAAKVAGWRGWLRETSPAADPGHPGPDRGRRFSRTWGVSKHPSAGSPQGDYRRAVRRVPVPRPSAGANRSQARKTPGGFTPQAGGLQLGGGWSCRGRWTPATELTMDENETSHPGKSQTPGPANRHRPAKTRAQPAQPRRDPPGPKGCGGPGQAASTSPSPGPTTEARPSIAARARRAPGAVTRHGLFAGGAIRRLGWGQRGSFRDAAEAEAGGGGAVHWRATLVWPSPSGGGRPFRAVVRRFAGRFAGQGVSAAFSGSATDRASPVRRRDGLYRGPVRRLFGTKNGRAPANGTNGRLPGRATNEQPATHPARPQQAEVGGSVVRITKVLDYGRFEPTAPGVLRAAHTPTGEILNQNTPTASTSPQYQTVTVFKHSGTFLHFPSFFVFTYANPTTPYSPTLPKHTYHTAFFSPPLPIPHRPHLTFPNSPTFLPPLTPPHSVTPHPQPRPPRPSYLPPYLSPPQPPPIPPSTVRRVPAVSGQGVRSRTRNISSSTAGRRPTP